MMYFKKDKMQFLPARVRCVLLSVFLFAAGCAKENPRQRVYLFAASSLTDVLPAVAAALADSLQDIEISYNFAASSILARQILAGSPADLFISASPVWVEALIERKRLPREWVVPLLANKLAVVVRNNGNGPPRLNGLGDLLTSQVRFIALGDPAHVPAGMYAKQALEKAGLWRRLRQRVVSGQNVRAALSFVEAGEADAAIVYVTDVRVSPRVKLAFVLPDSLQPQIVYTLAVLDSTPVAKRLAAALRSPPAAEIYARFGFKVIPGK